MYMEHPFAASEISGSCSHVAQSARPSAALFLILRLSCLLYTSIVISIAINMIGGQLASMVKLPIFLDSVGTLISAVLLGPVIGMLTGLLTNLLWGCLLYTSETARKDR